MKSKTFTVWSNHGFEIKDIEIDNTSIGAVYSYTFEDIKEDHTITAKFNPYQIMSKAATAGVSYASNHVLDENGKIYGAGFNQWGLLGMGDPAPDGSYNNWTNPELVEFPYMAELPAPAGFIKICSGEFSTMALNESGQLYAWGEGYEGNCAFGLPNGSGYHYYYATEGQSADPDDNRYFFTPTEAASGYLFSDFSHGYYTTFGVEKDSGRLYSWGYEDGAYSFTGHPSGDVSIDTRIYEPKLVEGITDTIKFVHTEFGVTGVVTETDRIFFIGEMIDIFEFDPGNPCREIDTSNLPDGETITSMMASDFGIMISLSDGSVWYMGSNGSMLGTWSSSEVPSLSACYMPEGVFVTKVIMSQFDNVYWITDDNRLFFYEGSSYTTGIAEDCNEYFEEPTHIVQHLKVSDLGRNSYYVSCMLITTDGKLYSWGRNTNGMLGRCTGDFVYDYAKNHYVTEGSICEAGRAYTKENCMDLVW